MAVESVVDRTAVARDRVRWGPIWTGLLTTLSLFLLLELMAYAFGWLTLGSGAGNFPGGAENKWDEQRRLSARASKTPTDALDVAT